MPKLLAAFSLLCVSFLALFLPLTAFAVEPAPEVLEEVVVTATKTPVAGSQLTSAVEIIKGEGVGGKKIKTVGEGVGRARGGTGHFTRGPGAPPPGPVPGGGKRRKMGVP